MASVRPVDGPDSERLTQPRVTFSRKHSRLYRGITLLHATKNGGPVLRGEASWRTVNAIMINSPWGHAIFTFRYRRARR